MPHSTVKSVIYASFEKINIADWLFNLPDPEYLKCSHNHAASPSHRPPLPDSRLQMPTIMKKPLFSQKT